MSTLQENLDRIKNAKSAIKNAIIQKGIDVTDTEKIETYADKILQIKSGGGTTEIPEFDPDGPLTIYCFDDWGDAYVQFSNNFKNGKVSYSKDKETWTQYKGEILKLTKGEFVQFKGNIIVNNEECHFTIQNGLFNLYGNLTSLYSYNDVASYSTYYISMFSNTTLYDCSNLNFGITYIKEGIRTFEGMFNNCIYMIRCPKILPATKLTESCYASMFYGCAGLTTLPKLPATTLATFCYSSMFNGCISLKEIPSDWILPATTLAAYCYSNMFIGCISLKEIPSDILPATTLANSCYYSMFQNCTSLTTIPINLLPATTLAGSCYYSMFQSCTSLTTIPNLPATTLTDSCYAGMFSGCKGLVEPPTGWYLPSTTLATKCYNQMFYTCSKLQKMAVAYSGTDFDDSWGSPWYNFMQFVSSKGTFYYSKNQTKENIQSIVPSGWTLVQSTEW